MKPTEKKMITICSLLFILGVAAFTLLSPHGTHAQAIPQAVESVVAEDGSIWERVSEKGFGNKNNICVVSMCPYRGSLYALARNEASGFQIWRTHNTTWEQVTVPGFTDSVLHDLMNAAYGKIIEFNGSLYVAIGSGYEGAFLYRSISSELWRFDGEQWEAVVSNSLDEDEGGTITGISDCADDDGATTAQITDSSKSWTADQWKGGILRVTSGEGKGRVFEITGNTGTALIIQQNEEANTDDDTGAETEYTVCEGFVPDPEYPNVPVGTIAAGDSYEIGMGEDENGFGELWNKNFIDMAVHNNELYIGISHNYEDGTRVWKSADGTTWTPASQYAFSLFHGLDPQGNPTGECLITGLEDTVGNPVCSSATHFGTSDVSGTETLYIGGTGSSGCAGRGARAFRLDGDQWTAIVDNFVDDNDEGTNENGFGFAPDFINANFQAWTWAEYDDRLFCAVARVTGGRIMYTATGGTEDGAWTYAVGGDSAIADGFDGVADFLGYGANIGANLYTFDSALYAGTLVVKLNEPIPGISPLVDGADIWRATGSADALVWTRITGDGFGDEGIQHLESFTTFEGSLYVAASNLFSGNAGQTIPEDGGAKIYRLVEVPGFVSINSLTGNPDGNGITLQWSTDVEEGLTGFNIYHSGSEAQREPYEMISSSLIPATGAGSSYDFTDTSALAPGTYYYKVESVDSAGNSKSYGPLAVTVSCPAASMYGEAAPETLILRKYRDEVLSQSIMGRALIRAYYSAAPRLVQITNKYPAAGTAVKKVIDALLPLIEKQVD